MNTINPTIEKIQKLMAMAADDKASENERNKAAKVAVQLMRRYSLSQFDIDNYQNEDVTQLNFITLDYCFPRFSRAIKIQRIFISKIAQTNFCRVTFISQGRGNPTNEVQIFGTSTDAQLTIYAFEACHNQIVLGANEAYESSDKSVNKGTFMRSFYLGAVTKVTKKLEESMTEVDNTLNESEFAIVHVKSVALEKAFNEENPNVRSGTKLSTNTINYNAYVEGSIFGDRVVTSKGVTGNLRLTG